jgi:RNA polymerase sigma-70 factor (ECF subfamily)
MSYVPSRAVAEEVVQETWLGVVRGIARFEGRSSLKTWLFRIVVNRARTAGTREKRTVPVDPAEPTVPGARFDGKGGWAEPLPHWADEVEDRMAAGQLAREVMGCMSSLPELQRTVVTLRDLEGVPAIEVCDMLGISEANQRVLLHRGRSKVRHHLERVMSR